MKRNVYGWLNPFRTVYVAQLISEVDIRLSDPDCDDNLDRKDGTRKLRRKKRGRRAGGRPKRSKRGA